MTKGRELVITQTLDQMGDARDTLEMHLKAIDNYVRDTRRALENDAPYAASLYAIANNAMHAAVAVGQMATLRATIDRLKFAEEV